MKGWERMLAEAQAMITVRIGGVAHARIAYGKERRVHWDTSVPCHDCTAAKGQLHVLGCDVEECPKCSRQLISCDCTDLDDNDDDDDDDDDGDDDGDKPARPWA